MPAKQCQLDKYAERKAAGICVNCAKASTENGQVLCEPCRAMRQRNYKIKKGTRQKCETCDRQTNFRAKQCFECRGVKRAAVDRYQKWAKENGRCISCGKPKEGEDVYCQECAVRKRKKRKDKIASGQCERCGRQRDSEKFSTCEACRVKLRDRQAVLKLEVFNVYGGAKCCCCGETASVFLGIDHIDNNGGQHRRQDARSRQIYRWLKLNGYPSGYQVLCMNCNWAKRFGECPHKSRKT